MVTHRTVAVDFNFISFKLYSRQLIYVLSIVLSVVYINMPSNANKIAYACEGCIKIYNFDV